MQCEIEYVEEFGDWWNELSEDEQDSVNAYVNLLEARGVRLLFKCRKLKTQPYERIKSTT